MAGGEFGSAGCRPTASLAQPAFGQVTRGSPLPAGSVTSSATRGVSTRRKPPCRRELAFDLKGARMSAVKNRGNRLDGAHHRG